ncbi:MAG TPA: restriction endonuclease subunit S [Thermoanaerobaculia bacterium]|nr:restriction endonuclease subunit S [Thermoanaerobaculia bacterium]
MITSEWIRAALPRSWGIARLRDHATVINGYPFDSELFSADTGMPLVRIRDISSEETEIRYTGDLVPAALLRGGEILIGMDGDFNVSRWRGGEALLNQRVCCVRPARTIDARFLYYVLPAPLRLINEFTYSTTVKHLSSFDVLKIHIPFPSLPQQRTIANYLDRETARLDALVTAKERVLGLLAEKRRALITRAVTRGLDPRAPLRDSGVPWLDKIPAHWEMVALRFLVDISGGATPDTGKPELWDGDIPWVSPKDMKRAEIGDVEDHVSSAALSASALRLIDPGAVLIVVRGMILAHSFPTATTTRQVTINQDMKALRCRSSLEPHFLRGFFWGVESHLVSLVDSAAHGTRKLDTEVLGRLEVCVPPLNEQRAIVAHISEKSARLDELRSATERTIILIKERRAALIAAAVTGQVDVSWVPESIDCAAKEMSC